MKMDPRLTEGLPGDPRKEAIAGAVASVGRALGFATGAQGVAHDDQRALLARLGFALGQGELWGPALDPEALAEAVTRRAG